MNTHLAFITNNAGYDIPGSTIRSTIQLFRKDFTSVVVVDGNLTDEAIGFYVDNQVTMINSPWTGRHVDQYRVRNSCIPNGDWVLALDCDEVPSPELVELMTDEGIRSRIETEGINIVAIPVQTYWCKHNTNKYYAIEPHEIDQDNAFRKFIFYKNLETTSFVCDEKLGTHVTPSQGHRTRLAKIPTPYYHMKSPETMLLNICICLMEDIHNPRGIDPIKLAKITEIGTKYDILNGPKFRRITKAHEWPDELIQFAIEVKDDTTHLRHLYHMYHAMELKTACYETACDGLGDHNEKYKANKEADNYISLSHTDVQLANPDIPVGAG